MEKYLLSISIHELSNRKSLTECPRGELREGVRELWGRNFTASLATIHMQLI